MDCIVEGCTNPRVVFPSRNSSKCRAHEQERLAHNRREARKRGQVAPSAHWRYIADRSRRKNWPIFVAFYQRPCMDCGLIDPEIMEADHVRDKNGRKGLAYYLTKSTESLLREISKCDPVCPNCHKRRTNGRKGISSRFAFQ